MRVALIAAVLATPASAANATSGGVLLAFSGGDYSGWKTWPWDKITHLAFWTAPSDEVRAKAKANGVRLYQDSHLPDKGDWTDDAKRTAFAQEKVKQVKDKKLDGVLFDYEGNDLSSKQKAAYTALATAVTQALKPTGATVFVCVGGRPTYEMRDFDYAGLAAATEFLFIMAYDMHFWDDYTCVTKGTCSPAEAPIKDVTLGVTEYIADVPANKLVLGLPWYGQRYEQIVVPINKGQIPYSYIPPILAGQGHGKVKKKILDTDSQTWKIDCDEDCWGGAKEHQGKTIWFDDAQTLAPKYKLAKENKLLGVGMWEATDLPTDSQYASEAKAMWDAITAWNE